MENNSLSDVKNCAAASFLAVMLLLPSLSGANSLSRGKILFGLCKSCHGEMGEGRQELGAPGIAGLPSWYSIRQINSFKTGVRGSHVDDFYGLRMRPMAKTLRTEADIQAVADYVQSLKVSPKVSTLKGNATQGQAHYMVCMACHGPNAEGNKAMSAPSLHLSGDWYLMRQIKNFKNKLRAADPVKDPVGATMAPMAMMLMDDQAIADVLTYIGTLKTKTSK